MNELDSKQICCLIDFVASCDNAEIASERSRTHNSKGPLLNIQTCES